MRSSPSFLGHGGSGGKSLSTVTEYPLRINSSFIENNVMASLLFLFSSVNLLYFYSIDPRVLLMGTFGRVSDLNCIDTGTDVSSV